MPFVNAPRAVVAIKETQPRFFHVGIVHRSDDDPEPRMLHLAWHFNLQNEPADPDYYWVEPGCASFRARQVASICRLVARRHPKGLPYAFSDPDRAIDPMTGDLLLGPTRLGLTCASFVLSVFQAAGLPLVVLSSWPAGRDGDAESQTLILERLEHGNATPEHIAAVRGEIGCVRYRPTEIAAASSIAPPPATLDQVAQIEEVLRVLITAQKAA